MMYSVESSPFIDRIVAIKPPVDAPNTYVRQVLPDTSANIVFIRNRSQKVLAHSDVFKLSEQLTQKKLFPFESFDAVFSNGSLHEWTEPAAVLDEIYRVLRPGGRFCITDLRRDISLLARLALQIVIPKERKDGFYRPCGLHTPRLNPPHSFRIAF